MTASTLIDSHILVVEDEYLIAQDVERALEAQGAIVVGPVPSLMWADRLLDSWDRIDGAVVDLKLGSEFAFPLIDALLERAVPVVLNTGFPLSALPIRYRHLSRCEKAVSSTTIVHELERQISAARAV